ncbi:MAG: adenosylcobalamin-dependent ribonucleoside-diphosphate reductase [Candidatus Scalindua sp.]|jgi:ribonucleoside-diphosphate reductase alpha chain|nr:adenosylcobalamin-dependent ribonucleoside-diphosphate reductase [Candidatus Scalindua sp.]MDV5167172.1 adenosylcobalamin-dependent ribonucleoside-diphosphate reductase [Candidatus Scalindua sp.]
MTEKTAERINLSFADKNSSTEVMTDQKQESKSKKKLFSFEEALEASLEYFKGDALAARVWVNKYALKDSFGNIYELTPDDMHKRLASELSRVEKQYSNPLSFDDLYELIKDFKYIVPQGSPMTGIGNNFQIASLSNCFVIGHKGFSDSYGGIMKIDQEQVQLMKRRGGVGHDLSHIRPTGSQVLNGALTSTGVVPFMERYSNSTREVAQDGRRGALMLSISIKHPDAERFIDAKLGTGKVTGANVSVRIDDEFMNAVVDGTMYKQQYPVKAEDPSYSQEIDARQLWAKIVHNAWKSAEPGMLFWDTIIKESVADSYADVGFNTVCTNPCGEIPLCPYDSCRLLAINLYSYVEGPFTDKAEFNWEKFRKHIGLAQRIMDDIIDLELEKVDAIIDKIVSDPEDREIKQVEISLWENIKRKAVEGRRTGVGITAEGDMLAALGLRYGSENAIEFSVEVHKTIALEAYRSSVEMAKERGPFAVFDAKKEEDHPFINRLAKEDPKLIEDMKKHGRRNISLLTIAPTGTTSLMTQTTSGIEPVFLPVYKRRRKVNPNDKDVKITFVDEVGDSWEEYNVYHQNFITWLKVNGMDLEEIKDFDDKELKELVKRSPYYKATSKDIDWMQKVKMQGEIQKWVDHSISVTINLPTEATQELVGDLYIKAWESGCKGVTVYRDGSRTGVLLATDNKVDEKVKFPTKRPKELDADILRFKNNDEYWIAFVGLIEGKPYEIFTGLKEDDTFPIPKNVSKGKIIKHKLESGEKRYDFQYIDKYGYKVTMGGLSHQFNSEFWNYAKLISGVLRHGMTVIDAAHLVSSLHLDNTFINNWTAGVARALKKYIVNGTKAKTGQKCNECSSSNMIYQEGCLLCTDCGSSKCG